MGHAIYYCTGCSTQLRDPDFEKGSAFRFGSRVFCKACAPESVRSRAKEATGRIPKASPTERKTVGDHTSRILKVAAPPLEAVRPGGNAKWIVVAAGGAIVVLLAVAMATGGRDAPRPPDPPPPVVHQPPAPPPPPPPSIRDERPAEEALRKARDFAAAHPGDLAGQVALFEAAVRASEDTGHHAAAVRERDTVLARQKASLKSQIEALDASVRAANGREEFRAAYKLIEAARSKALGPDWASETDRLTQVVTEAVNRLYAAAKKAAVDARKKGAEEEVKRQSHRVDKWGIESMRTDLAAAVAAATPKPKPPPPPPPKEIDTYRKRWTEAMLAASTRDLAGALRKIEEARAALPDPAVQTEAAADMDLLRMAMAAEEEGVQVLSKTPKGQKVTFTVLSEAGRSEITGTVVRAEGHELELAREKGSVRIPVGEIASRSMGHVLKGRRDPRGSAVLCVLDGDVEGGKGLLDSPAVLPDKYWSFKAPVPGPVQAAARKLFYAADLESGIHAKAGDAVLKYAALLKNHAEAEFVRRNRATIVAKMERLRDLFFVREDLRAAGSFKAAKGEKDESYWKSQAEGDSGHPAENYVELAFSVVPETEYRCWAYIGGCCSEAITLSFQVSETAAEPGGETVAPSKHLMSMPFKNHAAHEGRGRPVPRWGWIAIPLPKFSAAGLKKVRIVTVQQGLCVGYSVVSSFRQAPPPPGETKDLERARIEARGGSARIDPSLVGHWKFADGSGTVTVDSSPSGVDGKLMNGGMWMPGTPSPWSPPSLRLEGKAYVNLGANLGILKNAPGCTIAAWIWADKIAGGNDQNKIFSLSRFNGAVPTAESRAALTLVGGGHLSAGGRSTDAEKLQTVKTTEKVVKIGAWTHVAGVVDLAAGSIAIYVNGVAQPTTGVVAFAAKSTPNTKSTCAAIGSEEDSATWTFQGRMSNLRVYNRALPAEEIAELAVPAGALR